MGCQPRGSLSSRFLCNAATGEASYDGFLNPACAGSGAVGETGPSGACMEVPGLGSARVNCRGEPLAVLPVGAAVLSVFPGSTTCGGTKVDLGEGCLPSTPGLSNFVYCSSSSSAHLHALAGACDSGQELFAMQSVSGGCVSLVSVGSASSYSIACPPGGSGAWVRPTVALPQPSCQHKRVPHLAFLGSELLSSDVPPGVQPVFVDAAGVSYVAAEQDADGFAHSCSLE